MAAFGGATALVAGTITLTIPSGTRYWFFQNQAANPMKLVMSGADAFNSIVLNPSASGAGYAGDWVDSNMFPFFGATVVVTGTSTDQFGSGSTTKPYGGGS